MSDLAPSEQRCEQAPVLDETHNNRSGLQHRDSRAGSKLLRAETHLTLYAKAKQALAECVSVDEVKDIADKAAAMKLYAQQAKDKALEVDAAEIRIRAVRRLGEMLAAQKAAKGLNKGGRPPETGRDERPVSPTLADAGISKDLSSRAQAIAAVPEDKFEKEVADWRDRVQQEGERVTSRLVAKGRNEKAADEAEVIQLRERVAELEAQLAEMSALLAETLADNESMGRVFEADDQVQAALAEAKRHREMNRVLEERARGYQNERNDNIRQIKAMRRALEKFEGGHAA